MPITETLNQSDFFQSWRPLASNILSGFGHHVTIQQEYFFLSAKLPGGGPLSPVALILPINMSWKYGQVILFLKLWLCSELYSFLWVIAQHLNFMCRCLGTLFHLPVYTTYTAGTVPKRRHIKFRRRGITQKKERIENDKLAYIHFLLRFVRHCFHIP